MKSILSLLSIGEMSGGGLLCFLLLPLLVSCTEADGLMERSEATVRFSLSGSTVVTEPASTRADDAVSMEKGTTIRVLAYRRPEGGGSAVLSSANYMGEATYKVTSGGALELCGIKLDANGVPAVDPTATLKPLQLIAGTYDFYAVTPALNVDHSGNDPTLKVRHYTDYAVSVTEKTIEAGDSMVGLNTLKRRCTLLTFGTDLKEGVTTIASALIDTVQLTVMATEPITAVGTGAFDVAHNSNNGSLKADKFSVPDPAFPCQSVGQVLSLPKSEATFGLKMKVRFDGATDVTEIEASNVPAMAFVEGLQYSFKIRFKERGADLVLSILPWNASTLNTSTGSTPLLEVVLGEWTELVYDTSIGGTPPTLVSISGWTPLVSRVDVGQFLPIDDDLTDWHPDDLNPGLGGMVGVTNDATGWHPNNTKPDMGGTPDTDDDVAGWNPDQTKPGMGGSAGITDGKDDWNGHENNGGAGAEVGTGNGMTDWTGNGNSTGLGK